MARNKKNWDYLVDSRGQYQPVLGIGDKGQQGAAGAKGNKGEPGSQGLKGEVGTGLKGEEGEKGDKGSPSTSAFEFQGQVADEPSLPTSGNERGDVWQTLDTGTLFVWNGSAWLELGANATSIKGDKGEEGAKGDKGEEGVAGDKGAPGVDGSDGAKGEPGATGSLPLISSLPVLP